MSFQSQHLLTRESLEERQKALERFLYNIKDAVPLSNIQITCVTTMKRNSAQLSGVDVIVVGTELGSVYWIDSQAYSLLAFIQLPCTPEKVLAMGKLVLEHPFILKHIVGQYDIDSKTVICSREGEVFILKRDAKNETSLSKCHMRSHVLAVVKARNQVSNT